MRGGRWPCHGGGLLARATLCIGAGNRASTGSRTAAFRDRTPRGSNDRACLIASPTPCRGRHRRLAISTARTPCPPAAFRTPARACRPDGCGRTRPRRASTRARPGACRCAPVRGVPVRGVVHGLRERHTHLRGRGEHAVQPRQHVAAALLLGHAHADGDAALVADGHVARVVVGAIALSAQSFSAAACRNTGTAAWWPGNEKSPAGAGPSGSSCRSITPPG